MNQRTLRFAAILVTTLTVLAVLNELPRALGGEPRGIVAYDSVRAVEARYRQSVWLPPQLPGGRNPQPSVVRVAVGDPDWLQLRFGNGDSALIVCQTLQATSDDEEPPGRLMTGGDVLQVDRTMVGAREAQVRRVLRPDGAIVHELWWRERGKRMMLRVRDSSEDLMAIARLALGERR